MLQLTYKDVWRNVMLDFPETLKLNNTQWILFFVQTFFFITSSKYPTDYSEFQPQILFTLITEHSTPKDCIHHEPTKLNQQKVGKKSVNFKAHIPSLNKQVHKSKYQEHIKERILLRQINET